MAPNCTTHVKHGTIIPTANTSDNPACTAKCASDPEKIAVTAPPAANQAAVEMKEYPSSDSAVTISPQRCCLMQPRHKPRPDRFHRG